MATSILTIPPDHLYVELTDRCNLRCRHCYLGAGPRGERQLDSSRLSKALEEFASMGGQSVTFSGGEPLIHPDWRDLIAAASRLGLAPGIVTNGVLLSDRAIGYLLESRATINISLDAAQAAAHDFIRGSGSFAKVRAAMRTVQASAGQQQVTVCFTPMKPNLHELAPLVSLLAAEGFPRLYISPPEARGRGEEHAAQLMLDDEGRYSLLLQLALLLSDPQPAVSVDTGHLKYFFGRLLDRWDGGGDPIEGTLRITPNAEVFLTAYVDHPTFRLGTLSAGLAACWYSPRTRDLVEAAWRDDSTMPRCRDCAYWIVCGGGSPARGFARTASLVEPDEFCQAKFRFLDHWFRANTDAPQ